MPQGWDLRVLAGQKFYFLNMVMWHIKLKWLVSSPGYTVKFYPGIKKLVALGWGQNVKYHEISSRGWEFAITHHRCVLVSIFVLIKLIVFSAAL